MLMLLQKNTIFTFLILIAYVNLYGQQLPLYTQYQHNWSMLNPATVNMKYFEDLDLFTVGASYRMQWLKKSYTPRVQAVNVEYFLEEQSLLTGGYILNHQTGPIGTTGAYGRIGGILSDESDRGGLAVALNFGAMQFRVDPNKIKTEDPLLDRCACTKIIPDVGFGLFYFKTDLYYGTGPKIEYFYAGISMPQAFNFATNFNVSSTEQIKALRVRHYYGMAGFQWVFSEFLQAEPSFWVKYTPNAPTNVDFNLKLRFVPDDSRYFSFLIGAGYSTSKTIHLLATLNFPSISISYGFDQGFNSYSAFFGPAYELSVTYVLDND